MDTLTISNIVLSVFVGFHICCEFYHYVSEFFNSKRDKQLLEHIDVQLDRLEKMHTDCRDCKERACNDKENIW